jgi:hypothetical protein
MLAPPQGRANLELVHFPLYSAVAFAGAAPLPRDANFFNYAQGSQVSGAGTAAFSSATRLHTNMETANFLAAPKTFTVMQLRLVHGQLSYAPAPALGDDSLIAAPTPHAQQDDLLLLQSMALRFFVGPKDYVQVPGFLCPGNAGIGGVAAVSYNTSAAATAGIKTVALHTAGRVHDLSQWPVLIANQQSFGAQLVCQWGTNPSLVNNRLVWVVLEGILGREVS